MSAFPIPMLNPALLVTILLLSVRIGALLLMTPLLTPVQMTSIRVILVFSLAIALALACPQWRLPSKITVISSPWFLFSAACKEFALGALMALGVQIALSAFSIAGRLLDVQIGFGLAQIFDPMTRQQSPILTTVFNQVALLLFFLANIHHSLLRGLAYSIERFPPGQAWSFSFESIFNALLHHAGSLFTLGFAMAAPVVFAILLLECAVAILTRSLPQMNLFVIGIPAKILVGAMTLSLLASTGIMARVSNSVYASIFQTWQSVFKEARK